MTDIVAWLLVELAVLSMARKLGISLSMRSSFERDLGGTPDAA